MVTDLTTGVGKLRVAIASSDGRMVDEHFGSALQFIVLEVEGTEVHFVEARQNQPACGSSSQGSDKAAQSIALIGDCQVLLTVRAGPSMVAKLNAAGIEVVFTSQSIEESLSLLNARATPTPPN